jgi:hypothetical protein
VPNPNGNPASLPLAEPGNERALKHGAYSGRRLAERAAEVRDALMELPHAQPLDVLAAEEIGSVIAALEAIDRDLEARGPGATKTLLEHKARLGRELRAWLREFGGLPRSRYEWARELAGESGLGAEIRKRLAELGEGAEG